MRLKASIWVNAYIRQLGAVPIPAMVARRGDPDAGAIFIKVNTLDGSARVFRPALSMLDEEVGERRWTDAFQRGGTSESEADAYLARQANFDSDMWVIEVEDRDGRHHLDDYLVTE